MIVTASKTMINGSKSSEELVIILIPSLVDLVKEMRQS